MRKVRSYPPPATTRPRQGVLRQLSRPQIGGLALGIWLLGSLLLPLLHQLNHDHDHTHTSHHLVRWGDQHIERFALRTHHTHKRHQHHTHRQPAHQHSRTHKHTHPHFALHTLWQRTKQWLHHVWSHHHHHHQHHHHQPQKQGHRQAHQQKPQQAHRQAPRQAPQQVQKRQQDRHRIALCEPPTPHRDKTDASPLDLSHGEGSLAHFDLMNKTTAWWLACVYHRPQPQPQSGFVAQRYRTTPYHTSHSPRAPPA